MNEARKRVLPYGERALLVEVGDSAHALALAAALTGRVGVLEVVPGACTVLVLAADATGLDRLHAALEQVGRPEPTPTSSRSVELAVHYDGLDLSGVADELDLSIEELVRRHSAADYTVAFCGFAPGFAYLTGLDPRLHVGRRDEARTAVPAGSVGIAGAFTGVYPRRSPGGWQLLGRTDAELWDLTRERPALLEPGLTVRFVPVGGPA